MSAPACPDHGATCRTDGSCMVRGCKYGERRPQDGVIEEAMMGPFDD